MPNGQSKQSLLELFKVQPHMIFFGNMLILCETFEDVGCDLWVYDKNKIEPSYEEAPCIVDDFVIVSFIGDG